MGRPWEYPRWRRVLMQILMWVILGGTLGLAQLVTYQRKHAVITLGPAVRMGPLLVRVPLDWSEQVPAQKDDGTLRAIDPDRTRELTVTLEHLDSRSGISTVPSDQVESISTERIPFAGLQETGIMTVLRLTSATSDQGPVSEDVLMALAGVGPRLVLKITLVQGNSRIGPADRALVEMVANGITRVPSPPVLRQPINRNAPVRLY